MPVRAETVNVFTVNNITNTEELVNPSGDAHQYDSLGFDDNKLVCKLMYDVNDSYDKNKSVCRFINTNFDTDIDIQPPLTTQKLTRYNNNVFLLEPDNNNVFMYKLLWGNFSELNSYLIVMHYNGMQTMTLNTKNDSMFRPVIEFNANTTVNSWDTDIHYHTKIEIYKCETFLQQLGVNNTHTKCGECILHYIAPPTM